jgi:hypothetical protein
LSDGHASSDPIQGFAVSMAACEFGYDCTVHNSELFGECLNNGTCSAGTHYSDLIKQTVGDNGYARVYARAQQLEDAIRRGDVAAIKHLTLLRPDL